MPGLNPIAVVGNSPMLSSTFDVVRATLVMSPGGRSKSTSVTLKGVRGVVCAAGGKNGQSQTEDAVTATSTYIVIAKCALRKQANGIIADVVLWRGLELQVTDVEDYLVFGEGWTQATATSQKVADLPLERKNGY